MNNTLSVAVICTPDNQANISCNAIDSIVAQTLKPERMIIVYDRAQSEAIAALQRRIEKTMPNSQLICVEHDPDTTFMAARNNGLNRVGDCRYIHFVNSDIQLPKDFYEKVAQGLMRRSDCVAAMPALVKFTNSSEVEINSKDLIENPWLWLMRSKLEIASVTLLCSSAIEKAGKFNPLLLVGADTDFFARLSNQGAWCYISDCVVSHSRAQTEADMQLQFHDYHRRWALVYENLLDTYSARNQVPRQTYKSILAKAWYEAGLELLSHQRIEEARDCFMRSLSWRLFNPSFKYLMKISRLIRKVHPSKISGI